MNRALVALPAIAFAALCAQAQAEPTTTKAALRLVTPTQRAILDSSPVLAATPGAKQAAARTAAATARNRSVTTTMGTSANLHAEDKCILADLGVSRFVPSQGLTTTYLNYSVRNFCNSEGNASGSTEIPDAVFSGDPRTGDAVKLKIDLSSIASQLQGTPLVVDLTWTKTNEVINQSKGTGSTTTRAPNGVITKVAYRNANTSQSTAISGTANLFPVSTSTGTMAWDEYRDIRVIK